MGLRSEMTQKSGVLSARKKKTQSHSIARYRSKVKRQIILHLENKNVVILYPPYGPYASVNTHFVGHRKKHHGKTTD